MGTGPTQRRLVANSIAQKIPRANGRQLRETLHETLSLRAFANARRTNEDDASGTFELLSGHTETICRYAERKKLLVAAGEARSFEDLYTTASF